METGTPLVSVIIPTIPERSSYLKMAVGSVKNQTYKNIEIIIVDEGLSASKQRNIGISRANGEYIAFLDDDDEWKPKKTEIQVNAMQKNPDCPLVVSYFYDFRSRKIQASELDYIIPRSTVIKNMHLSSTSTYLCRATSLKEVGGFDETLESSHEYDLAIRLSKLGNIICVPKVLMVKYSPQKQITTNWTKKIRGTFKIYSKYGKEYSISDHAKILGILGLYITAYVFGTKIYKIINLAKKQYQKLSQRCRYE